MRIIRSPQVVAALAAVWVLLAPVRTGSAYVDLAPTLAKVISDSKRIAVLEVTVFSREKNALALKEVRPLRGEASSEAVRLSLATAQGTVPRAMLQWAQTGSRGVIFMSDNTALLCIGQKWFQLYKVAEGWWKLGNERPDLPLAFYGSAGRLAENVERILAGKTVVLTVVSHGAEEQGASFDLALNRTALPGLVKVQRVRANLKMPPRVMAASSSAFVVGSGPVDPADLPEMMTKLQSTDAAIRADAANDIRWLGPRAKAARASLEKMLKDASPRVRCTAAAALLQMDAKAQTAMDTLNEALGSTDAVIRREAAEGAGLAGPGAAPLAPRLATLLTDADEPVRITSLQAIAMLGPAAAKAAVAIEPLLEDAAYSIEAADALGRIGPAAQPAMKTLAKMLNSEQPAARWAAIRAMSQIGGPNAKPAVESMVKALPNATEVDGYNMMIYFAMLGPVATDAAPAIRACRIKNPVLPKATLWAIEPEKSLPWQPGGDGRFPMGPPGGGGGDGPDFARLIYEAYVAELGTRLGGTARVLAGKIMNNTAGDVPQWGYRILCCDPDGVLAVLTPHLTDETLAMRQRATVALGYMGPAAAPARSQVEEALTKAATERQRRLLSWCLREITRESR